MTTSKIENKLRNIVLTISYDGSYFTGWQKQKTSESSHKTVQGEIERALKKLHGHEVSLIGSGRTDSGVHARAQVANFFTDIQSIPYKNFIPALNSLLPKSIRIIKSQEMEEKFHARFSAKSRTYRYFLYCGNNPLAHELPYVWHINFWPNINRLNNMANFLRGEIDFTGFSASGDQSCSKFRYIYNAFFFQKNKVLVFEITANAFLWKMIRSLVGTFVEIEKKSLEPIEFKNILDAKKRKRAGPTAPPQGLFLWNISY